MDRASDMRDQLSFATPLQKMNSINLFCTDAYGSMLWDLQSDAADKFFTAWNIQARHAWKLHRETHTYLVSYLGSDIINLKRSVFGKTLYYRVHLKSTIQQ